MTSLNVSGEHLDEAGSKWMPLLSSGTCIVAARLLLVLGFLLAWDFYALRLGPLFVARPAEVLWRTLDLVRSAELYLHLFATLQVAGSGFLLGGCLGIGLPFLLRRSARLTAAVEPYILASMGVPLFALVPLLILWFGISATPKIVIVAVMSFYVMFINTFAGVRSVDGRLVAMAMILGAKEAAVVREIFWNSILPFIFAGLKIGIPRAISAAIVGEFLVSDKGLGFYIENARQQADIVGVYTGIVIVSFLVLVLNVGLERIYRRVFAWRPEAARF